MHEDFGLEPTNVEAKITEVRNHKMVVDETIDANVDGQNSVQKNPLLMKVKRGGLVRRGSGKTRIRARSLSNPLHPCPSWMGK